MRRRIISILLTVSLLAATLTSCSFFQKQEAPKVYDDNYRQFYEIYVRSFSDTNDDGIGDLQGVISKLDYLHAAEGADTSRSLGIDGVWLMPIFCSPSEHKYDVTDYYNIDPSYGTMEDFDELLAKFHERGIHLILDMVLNHTSSQHPWFQEAVKALNSGTASKYIEYYNFTQEPPLKNNGEISSDEEIADAVPEVANGWNPVPGNEEGYYYECQFWSEMPDLNLDNPEVASEIKNILKFWMDKGVDGYRLDACKYYYYYSMEDSISFLKTVVDYCKSINPDFYIVGEVWDEPYNISQYYRSGIDSIFNFDCSFAGPYYGLFNNIAKTTQGSKLSGRLEEWNVMIRSNNVNAIDAPFLSNHDTARAATYFGGSADRKTAASLYMLLPGNCFIYYGEEIGMKEGWKNDAEKRLPMMWSIKDNGSNILAPTGASRVGYPYFGVEEQLDHPDSILNHYRNLIRLKAHVPEIQRAQVVSACDIDNYNVAAYTCAYDSRSVMVLHNLTYSIKTVDLRTSGYERYDTIAGSVQASDYTEEEARKAYIKDYDYEVPEVRVGISPLTLANGILTIPPRGSVVLRCADKVNSTFITTTTTTAWTPPVSPTDQVSPTDITDTEPAN